tara:strand:- start:39 stop:635 length:597 start_codon:yes stop_codon:yes gene_type:complete
MSSIKLTADSGGGTFELKAPSSGSNARVMTLPDSADGTILTTTNPKAGNIIQVVSTTKTTSTSTTTSGSFTDISGMSVSITPSFTSSKILILISLGSISSDAGVSVGFRLLRGSTAVGNATNTTLQSGFTNIYGGEASTDKHLMSASHNFLDSPSTTSSTTYKLQWRNSSGTSYLNRYNGSSDSYNGSSTITVMEVAA